MDARRRVYGSPAATARCPRSAPCGVPKTRSNGPAGPEKAACSSREKMPPPSLLTTIRHRSGAGSPGPRISPGASCRNARSPRRAKAGPPPAAWWASAAPIAAEVGAVDAAGASAGQDADPVAGRHVVVQVADGQAGRRPQQGAVRQRRREVPRQPRFGQDVPGVEDLVRGAAGRRVRPQPRFQPGRARPAPSAVPVGFRATGQADSRGHVRGGTRRIVPPAGLPGDDDVARRRPGPRARLGQRGGRGRSRRPTLNSLVCWRQPAAAEMMTSGRCVPRNAAEPSTYS